MQGNVENTNFPKIAKSSNPFPPGVIPLMPQYDAYAIFRKTFDEF